MNASNSTYKYKIKSALQQILACAIAMAVLAAFVGKDVHYLVGHEHHHSGEGFCNEEAEQNGCHLALVHHVKDACSHGNHFSIDLLDCSLCDFLFAPLEFQKDKKFSISQPDISSKQRFDYISRSYNARPGINASRGPPSVL